MRRDQGWVRREIGVGEVGMTRQYQQVFIPLSLSPSLSPPSLSPPSLSLPSLSPPLSPPSSFSEVNSGFHYTSATEREKLVEAERKFTNDKVGKVIALKNKVCHFGGVCVCLSVAMVTRCVTAAIEGLWLSTRR